MSERTEGIAYEHLASVRTNVSRMQRMTHSGPLWDANRLVLSLSNQAEIDVPSGGSTRRPLNEIRIEAQADSAVQAVYGAKPGWTATASRPFAIATAAATAGDRSIPGSPLSFCTSCGGQSQASEASCGEIDFMPIFDCTVPYDLKERFRRAEFLSVDLARFLPDRS